jgi:hypothetical protein
VPFSFFDISLSLSRLRTTPAKKPCTECRCQAVACIIAAIVAPAGDCSIARTRDCFVPETGLFCFAALLLSGAFVAEPRCSDTVDIGFAGLASLPVATGFAVEPGPRDRKGGDFFADFAMRSSIRFCGYAAPPKPHHSDDAGGAGSQRSALE